MRVIYHFRTRGTGPEGVHIAGMVRALRRLGAQVEVVSPTGVDPTITAGTNPWRGQGQGRLWSGLAASLPQMAFELLELGYNGYALLGLIKAFGTQKPDLVYERHAFFQVASAALCRALGVPLVLEVNEVSGPERVREQSLVALARALESLAFRLADHIVVVSPFLKEEVVARGARPERVHVLPNAVDPEIFLQGQDRGPEVRAQLGLGLEPVIGFIGWFVPWHNLSMLMAAFAGLKHPTARLMLVGDGPLGEELRLQARDLGVEDRVIFPGPIPHGDIPAYIDAMDICVVPNSNKYRSPLKLFEYMARARAVVAPSTEPISQVIAPDLTGKLFSPGSQEGLAACLTELLGGNGARDAIGQAARALIEERYTWDHHARTVTELIDQAPPREEGTLALILSDIRQKALWYYGRQDLRSLLRMVVTDGTLCNLMVRLAGGARAIPGGEMLLLKLNALLTQATVGRGTRFGPGLVFLHANGVVINGAVRGGSRIYIEHQVTIGEAHGKSPVLGNDVFLGAGAKVIGGIRVGNNVRIGANAVVTKDLPDNCTAVGVPARVVKTHAQPLTNA